MEISIGGVKYMELSTFLSLLSASNWSGFVADGCIKDLESLNYYQEHQVL